VVNDLMAWRETVDPKPEILHWRTTQNEEVDFVVERDGKVFPIEIKSADRAKLDDVKSIQKFFKEYGGSVPHGLVLYNGSKAEEIADRIWAVPFGSALGL
jgi:predicted AAA+ superfamily ATPase